MPAINRIPTNIIAGFLGAGKSTAIRHLLTRRPPGERWAVLVNEFGQVGIDGALLGDAGVAVREIAGGCVCCAARTPLKVALTQLIRQARPQRLLIEPTGLGHPAGLIDALRDPWLAPVVDLRAVLCLVDPRILSRPETTSLPVFRQQAQFADVLVANKVDLASEDDLRLFAEWAARQYPPKQRTTYVQSGAIDPAWLELRGARQASAFRSPDTMPGDGPATAGCVFPPDIVFRRTDLLDLLGQWRSRPGLLRLKGVFRTEREWLSVNLSGTEMDVAPSAWRRDSRIDVVWNRERTAPDIAALEVMLAGLACG